MKVGATRGLRAGDGVAKAKITKAARTRLHKSRKKAANPLLLPLHPPVVLIGVMNPKDLKFSQESADWHTSDGQTLEDLTQSMRAKGWQGKPVEVVENPDGTFTSLDNRRIIAARRADLTEIPTNLHHGDEPFPPEWASAAFKAGKPIRRLSDGNYVLNSLALQIAHTNYLQNRSAENRSVLIAALQEAGYALEAFLLEHTPIAGDKNSTLLLLNVSGSVWNGRRAWAGDTPPLSADVQAGDIWLDTCEMTPFLLVARRPEEYAELPPVWQERMTPFEAWLALRPLAQWQVQTFLRLAAVRAVPVQVPPPLVLLDAARMVSASRETDAAAHLTPGEAQMAALFWGKSLPDLDAWQLAKEQIAPDVFADLWNVERSKTEEPWSEWVSYSGADEGVFVTVTKNTIDNDPEEANEMWHGEWTHAPNTGMRTALFLQTGLISWGEDAPAGPPPSSSENVWIINQAKRTAV